MCLRMVLGGLNIDATRIAFESKEDFDKVMNPTLTTKKGKKHTAGAMTGGINRIDAGSSKGRFPANAIFDEEAGKLLDEQSGITKAVKTKKSDNRVEDNNEVFGKGLGLHTPENSHNDSGGAARFFYCPKTPKKEKTCRGHVENKHPTVKPIKLMEWLIKLACPTAEAMGRQPVIIDCFVGSGSTALAANRLNVDCIGIDADEESLVTANLRLLNDWRLVASHAPEIVGYVVERATEKQLTFIKKLGGDISKEMTKSLASSTIETLLAPTTEVE